MKPDDFRIVSAYSKAMQALALIQVSGEATGGDDISNWRFHEMFKTLHDILGDATGELAQWLDDNEERKAAKRAKK